MTNEQIRRLEKSLEHAETRAATCRGSDFEFWIDQAQVLRAKLDAARNERTE